MYLRNGPARHRLEARQAPTPTSSGCARRRATFATALGGRFADNPMWFLKRVITVHPLGGAPMGRHSGEGVVDPYGNVFGYPGLHIADGSVMPGPDRAEPQLHDRRAGRPLRRPDPRTRPTRRGGGRHMTVPQRSLHRGDARPRHVRRDRLRPRRPAGPRRVGCFKFHLTIEVDDIERFANDPMRPGRRVRLGRVRRARRPAAGRAGRVQPVRGHRAGRQAHALPAVVPRRRRPPADDDRLQARRDDAGFDVWRDTTTLFTRVLRGHVRGRGRRRPSWSRSGVLRIRVRDFAKQLTTFRAGGPGVGSQLGALVSSA